MDKTGGNEGLSHFTEWGMGIDAHREYDLRLRSYREFVAEPECNYSSQES